MNTTPTPDRGPAWGGTLKMLNDADFRRRLRGHDAGALAEFGYESEAFGDAEVKVVTSTRETFYVSMPPKPSADARVELDELRRISGGVDLGCAGSLGSAGTASCFLSCLGCVGSIGTTSTAA